MVTMMIDARECTVPDWVKDLRSYLKWMHSDEAPERGRFWWLQGQVWADTEMEDIFTHNALKTEFTIVVGGDVRKERTGKFHSDGVLVSNSEADLSGEPDATFVSNESMADGTVRYLEGKRDGYTVLEGSPDMVLEIVSRGSVRKDTVTLRQAYWEAGVKEYWLVDVRRGALQFDILRRAAKGFQASRKVDGWMKSSVFDKSFRLIQMVSGKLPEYTLEVR